MNIKYLLYLMPVCLVLACGGGDDVAATLTEMASDKRIDAKEIARLEAKPQKYATILTSGKVDIKKLEGELTRLRLPKVNFDLAVAKTTKPTYNVFLENSGSMDGFVKGRTAFESSIYGFLSDINTNDNVTGALNLHYINSEKIDFSSTVKDFIDKLEPSTFKARGGNRGDSDIEMILSEIVDETDDKSVSVFISDCLFSLKKVNNVDEYLINQSIGIKSIFAKKVNQNPNLSVLVIQLSSDFTGRFYTYDNKVEKMDKQPRPYYVWIMGNHDYIKDLMSKIDIEGSMEGHIKNYYCWSSADNNNLEYRTTPLNMIGSYRPDRDEPLTKIGKISKGKRDAEAGVFQFSIGVNLKGYGLHSDYITDKDNYKVSDDNYKIEEVRAITEKEKKRLNYPVEYSHLILVRSERPTETALEISLKQVFPKWITKWHWEPDGEGEDFNPKDELTKSFGLKQLLKGVHDAYKGTKSKESNFFTLTINIEN